jgi:hypothetical protein
MSKGIIVYSGTGRYLRKHRNHGISLVSKNSDGKYYQALPGELLMYNKQILSGERGT